MGRAIPSPVERAGESPEMLGAMLECHRPNDNVRQAAILCCPTQITDSDYRFCDFMLPYTDYRFRLQIREQFLCIGSCTSTTLVERKKLTKHEEHTAANN